MHEARGPPPQWDGTLDAPGEGGYRPAPRPEASSRVVVPGGPPRNVGFLQPKGRPR